MTEFDNKYVRAAGRAIEKGFGRTPVFNREGGSIPVVSTFQEELGLPSVLFGVGLPDENAHAPNEKLDLGNFQNGIIASAYLYQEIAGLSEADMSDDPYRMHVLRCSIGRMRTSVSTLRSATFRQTCAAGRRRACRIRHGSSSST